FAGTSARAIARVGHFNQALIFYHFGSVHTLLLAALDASSARRLARYREALAGTASLPELVRVMRQLYEEDLAVGHVAAVQELVAGASAHPGLRQAMTERLRPWVELAREGVGRMVRGTPLEAVLPVEPVAFAITALYLGMETMAHLDGDRRAARALFDLGGRIAPLADRLVLGVPG
ncbi:MAG: TetR/AcrR family transcriptional regulator, partial [Solirubrobacteraceae bacterium]